MLAGVYKSICLTRSYFQTNQWHVANLRELRAAVSDGELLVDDYVPLFEHFYEKWSAGHFIPTFLLPDYDTVDALQLAVDEEQWETVEKRLVMLNKLGLMKGRIRKVMRKNERAEFNLPPTNINVFNSYREIKKG